MKYLRHLHLFSKKAELDPDCTPSHISLYLAIFQSWKQNNFANPISVSRQDLMTIAKINSKVTYHKNVKTLHANGYIVYEPSFHPLKGSNFTVLKLRKQPLVLNKEATNSKSKVAK